MNIITKTAITNLKRNKSRNILIGIAIFLTTLLLTTVPTVLFDMMDLQFASIRDIYPTWHAMFSGVDQETAEKLKKDEKLSEVGIREDVGKIVCDDPDIFIGMYWFDENAARANRMEIEGEMPEKEDEIVVSREYLKLLGLEAAIGSRVTLDFQPALQSGLGMEETKEFTITGFMPVSKEAVEAGSFTAFVGEDFADQIISAEDHKYRVYFQVAETNGMTTDAIRETFRGIGENYGIEEGNVVENSDLLSAMYVDPAMYLGVVMLMTLIILAGVLTIYSIYYVSMMDKVQEYGKLRAIGATRRQIRQLVFREGFAAAAVAIPAGIICGTASGILILKGMVNSEINGENPIVMNMKKVMEASEVSLIKPWIFALAAGVALVTVYLALLRPMSVAGKISAIEAIRYRGAQEKRKKNRKRKGWESLNTGKLMMSNLGRNRKRTVMTIGTLGTTGIFFMVVATVLNCMKPQVLTADTIRGDISISLDAWSNDMMHPEREIQNIQQNNPLNEERKQQILSIDGVSGVEVMLSAGAFLEEMKEEDGSDLETGVTGLGEKAMEELERYVVEGSLKDPALYDGSGIILGEGYVTKYLDIAIGDTLHLRLRDGNEMVEREFKIAAYVEAPNSLMGSSFMIPSEALQKMCKTDLSETFNITVSGKEKEVSEKIEELFGKEEFVEILTYSKVYEDSRRAVGYFRYAGYGLLFVFGIIGLLNLVNTMINSVYVRRRELGMLQAIGMSEKQTVRMLQMEGVFYTAGTLVLSMGLGSIAGYGCFLWAKKQGMFAIRTYSYPVVPALVLAAVVLGVQLLITYLVNRNFKKASLIERIRFSE
ncbi:MAG: FtsX-like permease family protein [Clostridiales bacterium]|nr:FtsX-like permease family protein [Clostridiales bacterium]